jgi:lysozyme family protein
MEESYLKSVNHAMKYEVGPFWDERHPACASGSVKTAAERKATGYVNDPDDTGGETKFGVAKNANPDLNITTLTWDAAKRVYYRKYWLAGNCDDISVFAPKLAIMHFDSCVNHGIGRAARMLQEAVGATIDGDVGPKTLELVKKACAGSGGELAVCDKVATIRVSFYNAIVANKPSQKKFLNGWLARISDIRSFVKS